MADLQLRGTWGRRAKEWFKTYYGPVDTVVLVMAGDIDAKHPPKTKKKVQKNDSWRNFPPAGTTPVGHQQNWVGQTINKMDRGHTVQVGAGIACRRARILKNKKGVTHSGVRE